MGTEDSSEGSGNGSPAAEPEGTIEEVVLEHDAKIEYLHAMMQDQQKTLAALVKHLERPSSSPDQQDSAPWNLKDGSEKQRGKILGQLYDWIGWYNDTYPGVEEHVIPPCWFRHRAVVQELVAVFVAWQAAYCGLEEPDDAPAYWHERILHPTIARLSSDKAAGWGNCLGTHREPHPPDTGGADREAFQAWLATQGGT
ncbi:hypothetical protein [Arthrobacter sp. UCD-GKA]|uniref:hypothetical protein n=1 Tax=Arthrobacter sp. UCD-GKA TaxID=1913576 RepID=UPI001587219C|nr:hypothetical protein [Arthrobacter sp. UCD-GKA]